MLIIDAYNVLHTPAALAAKPDGLGVPDLVRMLFGSRYARRDVTVVCDGAGGARASGVRMHTVRVVYAGAGVEADDVIETLIERYHRGNPLEVVSSDKRLQRAARRVRARAIASETFVGHLIADSAKPAAAVGHVYREQVPLDRYSVDAWMAEFGVEPVPRPTPAAGAEPAPRGARRDGGSIGEPAIASGDRDAGSLAAAAGQGRPNARPKRRSRTRRIGPGRASLGETLSIELPAARERPDAPATAPPPPGPDGPAAAADGAGPLPHGAGSAASDRAAPDRVGPVDDPEVIASLDPLLRAALQEWRDRLTLDDLNMQKWMPDATPLRSKRPGPGSR